MMENNEITGFFKAIHEDIRKSIDKDVIDKFASLQNNSDRVKYVCDLNAFKDCELKCYVESLNDEAAKFPVIKDADLARSLKADGNEAVMKGNWLLALELYSQSYINMPRHLREELSVILANRSAALYHLHQYELCVDDIIRAIQFDFPRKLRHKVMERKARCLLALNRNSEAADAFKQTIASLDTAEIPKDKKQKLQSDAQIMIQILTKGQILSAPETPKSEPLHKKPPKAKLTGKSNKKYPALSEAVDIRSDEVRGRYAAAVRDVAVGEVVLVEKPFAKALLKEFSKTHCQNCFVRTPVPVACPKCPNVVFCSENCQKQALSGFHAYECPVLPLIFNSGCSITCQLAFRILTQKKLDFFKKFLEDNQEEDDVYKSDDKRKTLGLVGHEEKRSQDDLFHRTEMAAFLLKILTLSGFFDGKPRETPIKNEEITRMGFDVNEEVIQIGELILKNLQILQFNAHEVFELHCTKPEVGKNVLKHKGRSVFIGGAIFNTLSLFNHSCDPGVARYFIGDSVVVRTVKTINKGEEVSENYGPIFTNVPREQRQLTLKQQYWFDCKCKACEEDWPLYKDMNQKYMRFKCNAEKPCANVIAVPHDCMDLMIKCDVCQQHTNVLKGLKTLQDTDSIQQEGTKHMESGKYGEAIKKFIEVLKLFDSTLAPPYASYYDCVQNLRSSMLALGNYSFLK